MILSMSFHTCAVYAELPVKISSMNSSGLEDRFYFSSGNGAILIRHSLVCVGFVSARDRPDIRHSLVHAGFVSAMPKTF